jgi:hypothetical protein
MAFDPLPGKHGIDKLRPIGAVQWLEEEAQAAAAPAATVDYSQWIEMKPSTSEVSAGVDPNSILGSNSYDATGWTFTTDTTGNTHKVPVVGASWTFIPKDNLGTTVVIGNGYGVCFRIEFPDQPAKTSDIVVLCGVTQPSFAQWVGYGGSWDGSGGPDMARTYYNGSSSNISYAAASDADAAGQIFIGNPTIMWDDHSNDYKAIGPGFAAWMVESESPVGFDRQTKIKYGDASQSMGTGVMKLFLSIGEGGATDTFKIKAFYRIIPQYTNS